MTGKSTSPQGTPGSTTQAPASPLTKLTPVEEHQLRLPNRKAAGLENLTDAVNRIDSALSAEQRARLIENPFSQEAQSKLGELLQDIIPACGYTRAKALIIAHHLTPDSFSSLEERRELHEQSLRLQAQRLNALRQGDIREHCKSWRLNDAEAWQEIARHSPAPPQISTPSHRQELLSRVNLLQDRSMLRGLWLSLGLPDPSSSDTGYAAYPITREQFHALTGTNPDVHFRSGDPWKFKHSPTAALHPLGAFIWVSASDWMIFPTSATGFNAGEGDLKSRRINVIMDYEENCYLPPARKHTEAHELGHTLHATHTRAALDLDAALAHLLEHCRKSGKDLRQDSSKAELQKLIRNLVRAIYDLAHEEIVNVMSSEGCLPPNIKFDTYLEKYSYEIQQSIDALTESGFHPELVKDGIKTLTAASMRLRRATANYLTAARLISERPDAGSFEELTAIADLSPLHAPHRLLVALPKSARPSRADFAGAIAQEQQKELRAIAVLDDALEKAWSATKHLEQLPPPEKLKSARYITSTLMNSLQRESPRLAKIFQERVVLPSAQDTNDESPESVKKLVSLLEREVKEALYLHRDQKQLLHYQLPVSEAFTRFAKRSRGRTPGDTQVTDNATWLLQIASGQFRASEVQSLLPQILEDRGILTKWFYRDPENSPIRALSGMALACFDRATGLVSDGEFVTHWISEVRSDDLETLRAAIKTAPLVLRGSQFDQHSDMLRQLTLPKDVSLLARVCLFSTPGPARENATTQLMSLLRDDSLIATVPLNTLLILKNMENAITDPRVAKLPSGDEDAQWEFIDRHLPKIQSVWEQTLLEIQHRCREEIDRRAAVA